MGCPWCKSRKYEEVNSIDNMEREISDLCSQLENTKSINNIYKQFLLLLTTLRSRDLWSNSDDSIANYIAELKQNQEALNKHSNTSKTVIRQACEQIKEASQAFIAHLEFIRKSKSKTVDMIIQQIKSEDQLKDNMMPNALPKTSIAKIYKSISIASKLYSFSYENDEDDTIDIKQYYEYIRRPFTRRSMQKEMHSFLNFPKGFNYPQNKLKVMATLEKYKIGNMLEIDVEQGNEVYSLAWILLSKVFLSTPKSNQDVIKLVGDNSKLNEIWELAQQYNDLESKVCHKYYGQSVYQLSVNSKLGEMAYKALLKYAEIDTDKCRRDTKEFLQRIAQSYSLSIKSIEFNPKDLLYPAVTEFMVMNDKSLWNSLNISQCVFIYIGGKVYLGSEDVDDMERSQIILCNKLPSPQHIFDFLICLLSFDKNMNVLLSRIDEDTTVLCPSCEKRVKLITHFAFPPAINIIDIINKLCNITIDNN